MNISFCRLDYAHALGQERDERSHPLNKFLVMALVVVVVEKMGGGGCNGNNGVNDGSRRNDCFTINNVPGCYLHL